MMFVPPATTALAAVLMAGMIQGAAALGSIDLQRAAELHERYTAPVGANPHVAVSSDVTLSAAAPFGYEPSVDPLTVSTWLTGIVAKLSFDSYDPATLSTPDSSLGNPLNGPQNATNNGAVYLPSGGRYGGAFQFNGSSYLLVPKDPLSGDAPTTATGFSYAAWLRPDSLSNCRIWERQYDNMDLNMNGGLVCAVAFADTNGANHFVQTTPFVLKNLTWVHVGCAFRNRTLTLYVNGTARSNVTWPYASIGGFTHGSFTPLGIGHRPFAGVDQGFVGALDEFCIWNRALTASEWLSVYESPGPIQPFLGVTFVSSRFTNISAYTSLSLSVTASGPVVVSISTDSGVTWCTLASGVVLTMVSQGNNPACLFPAVRFTYTVVFATNVTLYALDVAFGVAPDYWDPSWVAPLGLNLASPSYYSNEWHFVDVMRETGNAMFGPLLPYNASNGYPLWVPNPTANNGAATLILRDQQAGYPEGNYTIFTEGTGTLTLAFDSGNQQFTAPGAYVLPMRQAQESAGGIRILIATTSPSDPVRNIRVVMPGFNATYDSAPFHPSFLNQTAGFSPFRFMDWGATNNNNMGSWESRARPKTALENGVSVVTWPIVSIAPYNASTFCGKLGALFTLDMTVTNVSSYNYSLVHGQQVVITNSAAYVNYTDANGQPGQQSLNLAAWQTTMDVLNASSFVLDFSQFYWTAAYTVTAFVGCVGAAQCGTATITVAHGAAYETIVQLANTQGVDAWINIPLLAQDEYVTNVARIVQQQLQPPLRVWVEYANEIWNYAFSANTYAYRMSLKLRLDGGSVAYTAYRSAQIFRIFETYLPPPRLRKVLPSMAANSAVSSDLLRYFTTNLTVINPYNVTADALAIAPYFGGDVASHLTANYLVGTATVDDVVDWTRASVETDTRAWVRATYRVTRAYNISLVAYEGGQSLVAGGNDGNNAVLTALLEGANRDPRMEGIYDNMLRAWAQEGGQTFNAFASAGRYSKYGSWGFKEYQLQPDSETPKYRSLRRAVARYSALQAATAAAVATSTAPTASFTAPPSSNPSAFPPTSSILLVTAAAHSSTAVSPPSGNTTPSPSSEPGVILARGFLRLDGNFTPFFARGAALLSALQEAVRGDLAAVLTVSGSLIVLDRMVLGSLEVDYSVAASPNRTQQPSVVAMNATMVPINAAKDASWLVRTSALYYNETGDTGLPLTLDSSIVIGVALPTLAPLADSCGALCAAFIVAGALGVATPLAAVVGAAVAWRQLRHGKKRATSAAHDGCGGPF